MALLVVAALNFLGVGFLFYPSFPNLRNDFMNMRRDQRPVHLTLVVKDQFGKAAEGYRIEADFERIRWYCGLFPVLSRHPSVLQVKTNKEGTAKIGLLFSRAYGVSFREIDTAKYVLAEGQTGTFGTTRASPQHGIMLKRMDGQGQVIELEVLRHALPAKLTSYRPAFPNRPDGVLVDPLDKNVFTLDITGNRFLPGVQVGDIVLTISNTEEACKAAQARLMHESTFNERVPLKVEFESQRGTEIQQADRQVVTFAPKEGYKTSLVYQMTIEKPPPSGWPRVVSPEDWYRLVQATPTEAWYQVLFGAGGIERGIFLMGPNKSWYGILHIMVDLQPEEGKLLVRPSGAYNPDGSTNLWKSSAVDWRWY